MIGTRKNTIEYSHQGTTLTDVTVRIGGKDYLATIEAHPSTVIIYNTEVSTANWTAVTTGLSNVVAWKLREREGQAFDYCFDGVGTTYMTSLGESLIRDTDLSSVYVKRRTAVTLNMQLEVWTA